MKPSENHFWYHVVGLVFAFHYLNMKEFHEI